jgi:2-C-methyl-D-erythritol 4-phosphate cytidylyltransferase
LIDFYGIKKVGWVLSGGESRQASVYNGLCALEQDCGSDDIVVVHDGVRPFITREIISKNIEIALAFGNAMTSIRSTDSLISSRDGESACSAMDRDSSFTVQTPQTYRLRYGLELYRKAYELGLNNTINCCEMFIELGEKVYIVNGRKTNVKLTTPDDIAYLKALHAIFQENPEEEDVL